MSKLIKKKNVVNVGLDTLKVMVESEYDAVELKELGSELGVTKTSYTRSKKEDMYIILEIKPCKAVGSEELCNNISTCIKIVENLLEELKCELIEVREVHISIDLNVDLELYKKLARYFILTTAIIRKIKKAFTVKDLFDLEEKTVKLESDRYEVTFYNKMDQPHVKASSRIEFRSKRLVEKNLRTAVLEILDRIIIDLGALESNSSETEIKVSTALKTLYFKKDKPNLKSFVTEYGNFIYTKQLFERFYSTLGKSSSPNKFLINFKRDNSRELILYEAEELGEMGKMFIEQLRGFRMTY